MNTQTPAAPTWRDVHISAPDGLRLHLRDQGPHDSPRLPVVCLAGLSRNAADFEEIAAALSTGPAARRVISLDYRGRGLSAWDPDPANYSIPTENADIQAMLTALDIGRAVFIGTSRGGLHAMALSATRPGAIAGVLLNDIGPEIGLDGLLRIKAYVGRITPPSTLEEGAAALERIANGAFPAFAPADWLRLAQKTFTTVNGHLTAAYDPALMRSLDAVSREAPPPALWHLFDGLAKVPLMVVRGECSDILLPETLVRMQERRPDLEALIVPGQGHVPPLWEAEVIARIAAFVARCDEADH